MKKRVILLILFTIVLASCSTLSSRFGFGGGGISGKGIEVKFIDAPQNNEKISEGIPIGFVLEISNYVTGENGISGELCLEDSLSDNFGGIPSNACQSVDLPPATSVDKRVIPSADVYTFGPYSYTNLQKELSLGTRIAAKFKYEVTTTAGAVACVKRRASQSPSIPANCGKTQTLSLQQPNMPMKISSISSRSTPLEGDAEALVQLDITLSRSTRGQLFTKQGDFSNIRTTGSADIDFDVLVNQAPAVCSGVAQNRVIIRQNEDQKVIKCTARVPLDQDYIQAPIIIKMGYGFIQTIDGPVIELRKEEAFV